MTTTVLWRWGPPILWMALIFAGSSVPGSSAPGLLDIPHADKVLHVLEYGLLGALLSRALWPSLRMWGSAWIWPVAVALAFGATDEIHQIFVPERDFSLWDLAADGIGATLGMIAWRRWLSARPVSQQEEKE